MLMKKILFDNVVLGSYYNLEVFSKIFCFFLNNVYCCRYDCGVVYDGYY